MKETVKRYFAMLLLVVMILFIGVVYAEVVDEHKHDNAAQAVASCFRHDFMSNDHGWEHWGSGTKYCPQHGAYTFYYTAWTIEYTCRVCGYWHLSIMGENETSCPMPIHI